MLLHEIEKNPMSALDYLERQVNNGSKSGFTDKHNTSVKTNPFYSDGYNIMKLIPYENRVKSFGHPNIFENEEFIFIHPDWLLPQNIGLISEWGRIEQSLWVIPTSSSRTVHIPQSDIYIKLHYPGIIGRLNRELGYKQIISGIEMTDIFKNARRNNKIPKYFEYMPESYGRLFRNEKNEIGYIVRKIPETIKAYYLIPGFSLFSNDRKRSDDIPLLEQILKNNNYSLQDFLEEICFKIIDVFFWCVLEEGIIPEMHSQNVLIAFDENWKVKKIVLRDFESFDKDIDIRKKLGKSVCFKEYPYKCIWSENKDYLRRHSFMYDHKLGEYLLDPLVKCAARFFDMNSKEICQIIRNYVKQKYKMVIGEFFPIDGCWYKYPNIEIDRSKEERPFISMGKALYR